MPDPEIKLLLRCLKDDAQEIRSRHLAALGPEEWQALITTAKRHRVTPILYHTLNRAGLTVSAPSDVAEELKRSYYANAQRNMLAYRQLENIVRDLNKLNIPVILLKGAHLAKYVYGNIALRVMADLDLLVRSEDIGPACGVLINHGYQAPLDGLGISEMHAPPFRNENQDKIELHFNIADAELCKRFDVEDFWQRAQPMAVGDATALALAPEDNMLHICIHSSIGHCFDNAMRALLDIRQIVEHYGTALNWERLIHTARQLRVTNALYFMLASTRNLLGLALDDKTLAALRPADNEMIPRAEALMFSMRGEMNIHISRLFGEKKLSAKLRHFFRRLLPAKETMTYAGGAAHTPFFYTKAYSRRIKYLVRSYGWKVLRSTFKDKTLTTQIQQTNEKNAVRDWLAS
ncbi:MAG TPA: nucleotidyltransferase family protein [Smithellaceae bacterium]|nr:nucleotidyltransferase family protein [Smithellaceae bacterium]HQG81052.1 nucleotidyltransferase family protein [Smithellaceae bacterium]